MFRRRVSLEVGQASMIVIFEFKGRERLSRFSVGGSMWHRFFKAE
jgi:hypothetical protein